MTPLDCLCEAAAIAFAIRSLTVARGSNERIEPVGPHALLPMLSIIVPARNEERQIEACVRSLLAQNYPNFEVVVVDDRSMDRTGAIMNAMGESDPRLIVVQGEALPRGWVGKPWALHQGARRARGAWLLFTDADPVHEALASSSAVCYAMRTGTRVLSLLPLQRFETAAERVVLPTILWMIAFAVGSLDAINDPHRLHAAIFNGQFLLFERGAYEALGGHQAVHDCIAEDYEFARIVKRDGRFRSRLAAGGMVSTRMYRSFSEIWNGFSKNLYVAAHDAPGWALVGTVLLAALSPLPQILFARAVLRRKYVRAWRLAATMGLTAAAAEAGMRHSRFPRGSGAYFPIGAAAMLAIFINSFVQHRTGRVSWRGRSYSKRTGGTGSQT